MPTSSPGQVAQLVGAPSHTPKVGGLIPGQATYLGCDLITGQCAYRRQPVDVSLTLMFLSLFVSLSLSLSPLSSLSKIKNISLGEDLKK